MFSIWHPKDKTPKTISDKAAKALRTNKDAVIRAIEAERGDSTASNKQGRYTVKRVGSLKPA